MKTNSQSKEIQKILDRILFGSVFYFMLCWFSIFVVAASEKKQASWSNGFIFAAISIIIYIVLTVVKSRMVNSSLLHYSIFLASLFNSLLIFDTSFRLRGYLSVTLVNRYNLELAIIILLTLLAVSIQVIYLREKLKRATKENIKSGRLNLQEGAWDLGFPIHFESKEIESRRNNLISWLGRFSPLVTAFTFIFARQIEGGIQTIAIAVMIFIMGLIYILDYSRHLAIALQISDWEKTNKISIKL